VSRVAVLLLIVVTLASRHAAAAAAALTPDTLAAAFVAALQSGEMTAFDVLDDRLKHDDWRDVRDLVEIRDCIEVTEWHVANVVADEHRIELDLRIEGHSVLRGPHAREVPLPARWTLVASRPDGGDWRLDFAMRRERYLAWSMLIGGESSAEALLQRAHDADLLLLIRDVADVGTDGADPARFSVQQIANFDCARVDAADTAVQIAEAAGDAVTLADTLRLRSTREFRSLSARDSDARRAVEIARTTSDTDVLAKSLFSFALSRWRLDDLAGARGILTDIRGMLDDVTDPRVIMKPVAMHSYIDHWHGDLHEALTNAQDLDELSRRFRWSEGEGVAVFHMADIHLELRQYDVARREYARVAEIFARTRNPLTMALAAYARGVCAAASGQSDTVALRFLRQALSYGAVGGAPLAKIHADAAQLLERDGRLLEADAELRSALPDASEGFARSDVYTRMASLALIAGHPEKALQLASRAVEVARNPGIDQVNWSPWPAYAVRGRALHAAHRDGEAIAALEQAIRLIESDPARASLDDLGRARFLDNKTAPYVDLVELFVSLGRNREAFAAAERMKGRTVAEALQQARAGRESLTEKERAKQDELDGRVRALNEESAKSGGQSVRDRLAMARAELERFESELVLQHPALRLEPRSDQTEALLTMPASLSGAALVEFVVGPRQTTVFVVTRGTAGTAAITARSLKIAQPRLRALVAHLRKEVSTRDYRYPASARMLYDLLLLPLRQQLAGRSICIVPDDVLWHLPFHVLLDADGVPLLVRHAVSYAPSLTMLRLGAEHRSGAASGAVLAFGDPYPEAAAKLVRSRDALPDALQEVQQLPRVYGAGRVRVYTGAAAREATFKQEAPHFRTLHIASHAIVDDGAPLYSAIMLAPTAGSDDGRLEAREILRMRLTADVAVLSACDTAAGPVAPGEGAVGLSWAFLLAGCPSTVVSGWPTDSAATRQLMIGFHRRMAVGDSPSVALRTAALTLMRTGEYAHPFYWGAFIVMGSP
jgi:CHAT domain-containing protein